MDETPNYDWTYADHPEMWVDEPSWLVKTLSDDGTTHVWANGWHRRQLLFERPGMGVEKTTGHLGEDPLPIESIRGHVKRYEIEIALDHRNDPTGTLALFVGGPMATRMISSMSHPGARVSANRMTSIADDVEQHDILAVNMPARSGNYEERLRAIPRWCRIFILPKGSVTLYEALDDKRLRDLRWPHYGIWLNRPDSWFNRGNGPVGTVACALTPPIDYMTYNLGNWRIEEALWRIGSYTADDERDLIRCRNDQRTLALFIKDAVLSARGIRRRTIPHLRRLGLDPQADDIERRVKDWDESISRARDALRDDADILSSVSQYLQTRAADRLNSVIESLSALILIPSVIISFFSMSILSADTKNMWLEAVGVLLACVAAAMITFVALSKRRRRK